MITQGNIIHFYNKYKENLGTEAQVPRCLRES